MDVYDREVRRLTKNPAEIKKSWIDGEPLFKFVRPEDCNIVKDECGCLTFIRNGMGTAIGPDGYTDATLTKKIRKDERIPTEVGDITVEALPVFAEWQRKLDQYYGRQTEQVS